MIDMLVAAQDVAYVARVEAQTADVGEDVRRGLCGCPVD
jgi:hypothetical protein